MEEFFREGFSVSITEEDESTDPRPSCSGFGELVAARKPGGGITTSLLLVMPGWVASSCMSCRFKPTDALGSASDGYVDTAGIPSVPLAS